MTDMTMTAIEEVTSGLRFPEGPIAMADGSVLVVEIERGTLTQVRPDGTHHVIAHLGGGPNGAAIGPDGAVYVCNNGGFAWRVVPGLDWLIPGHQPDDYIGGRIQRVDLDTGAVSDLYTSVTTEHGTFGLRGPNDLVFDTAGGFWFTDHGKVRERDRDQGGLYYALPDGSSITEVVYPLESPNGVGLSPDGGELYVAETHTGRVWAWPVAGPGRLDVNPAAPKAGGRLVIGLPGNQLLDSMAVDAEGNLWLATLAEAAGVTVVSPAGQIVERHLMPDPLTTNVAFGGPDLRTAYVCLSATGKLVRFEAPRPGLRLAFNR